jgi:D-alanyl-lipoteichoic acid acyltransferase DltB (MBOAT superfamily)
MQAVSVGLIHTGTIRVWDGSLSLPFFIDAPRFSEVLSLSVAGTPASWYLNWLALMSRFLLEVLNLAVWGHVMIAVCRMAGFRALRNTYKPLRSATIAEFWNRYYYYFKELLVEFFFYPAFMRYFKRMPRFRLLFATMAAAGFGNVFYHFMRDSSYIARLGLWEAFLSFQVYLFYGALLGVAIGLSQLRNRNRRTDRNSLRTRILAPVSVLAFYCVLSIFDSPDRSLPAIEYFRFAMHLIPGL